MPVLRSPHKLRQSTLNRRMQLANVEVDAEQQPIVRQNPITHPIIEEAPNLQQEQNSGNETSLLGSAEIRRRIMAGPEQAINMVADNVNNLDMNEEDLLQDNGNGIQFQMVKERDQREGGDPIEREQRFIAPEMENFGGEWDAERVFNPRAASTPHMILEREPPEQNFTARQRPVTGHQHVRGEQMRFGQNPGHMPQNQQHAAAYNQQQHHYAHGGGTEPADDRFYQRGHPTTHKTAIPTDVILGPPPRHGQYAQADHQHYNAPPPNFEYRGGYGRQNYGDEFRGGWTRNEPPPNFRREDQNFAAHQRNWGQAQYQQPPPIQIGNLEYVLTLDRLPELRGNEGADKVKQFFKKFSSATEGWPEKRRISALEAKVSGRAERALNAALANQPYRFDSIRRAMAEQLEVTDCREMGAFDELMSGLKRKPDESLDALADRIQSLVSRAYPGLTQNLGDDYAVKHLIRALANPELSLSLEMARRPGMSYDDFVALATRAESIQKATKRQIQGNIAEDRNRMVPTNNFRRFQQVRSPNFGQNMREGIVCFNCNESGHISRECRHPRRQSQFNAEQPQNRPQMATGANNTPMRTTGAEPNRTWQQPSPQNRPTQPRSQNFLKQNCIVAQENVNPNAVCHGVQLGPEITEFLEKELKMESGSTNAEERKSEHVGKILIVKVEVQGTETEAMLDGGAQISLISAQFFYKLIKEGKLDLREVELSRNAARIADVNGKEVKCYGSVTLQIHRKGCQLSSIRFYVTDASFGFNLLLGTNSLADLGFMLYDAANKEMIEFEKVRQQENTLRVIFQTKLRPGSTKLVEVQVGSEWNGKDVVISPISSGSNIQLEQTVGKVSEGKVIGQITNLAPSWDQPEEEEVTGAIELAEYIMDADNALLPTEPLYTQTYEAGEMEANERVETIKAMSKTGRISEPEKLELMNLLNEFEEIFAISEEELTQTDLVSHTIETGDAIPIRSKMRPVPYAYREKVSGMIQDYLGRGIIRPSFSPWASPIVIVPKKDGSLRFCVDYRGLNSVTVKDAFPLPNIDNTLLALGGKKVFTTLDFISGYWQIKMDPESIDKTAFVTEFGLHEFIVLPFGLSNAVATFQRFMTHLFEGLINDFVFIYIDDILVASESWDKHKEHLSTVFQRIREAGLKLKISKCAFSAGELPFLGHVLTSDGLKMDMDKMRPITEFPIPRSKKALQSFLGFLAYYRKFIYGFGPIAAPLYGLLKKDAKFAIGVVEEESINALKAKIMSDVLLHFPNFEAAKNKSDRKFLMLTDASKIGLGAVLCQPDEEGNIRPIYFASRQCNPHESRYCPTELEALAIRFGAKKFAQFITMLPTRVFTDHKALIYMFKSKTETGNSRVDKWLLELNSRFILQVEYQPGKKNVIADLLSRSPALKCPNSPQENEIFRIGKICEIRVRQHVTNNAENREEWVGETKGSELGFVYEFLTTKALPFEARDKQKLMASLHNFTIVDGLLYRLESDGRTRLVVPECFREKLIIERHSGNCAGHMSGKKIFRQLAEQFFWPNMYSDCIKAVQRCRICAHTRTPRANEPPLKVVQTTEPLELVCVDILSIGPAHSACKYILVAVDHFSKYLVAVPIPNKNADTIAQEFVKNFVLVLGVPKKIHSDRGKEFVNETLEEIASILKMEKSLTSGYDPQANGVTERVNQTILGMLKRSVASNWTWDERLPFVVFAYNTTPSEVTKLSPHQLIFGKPANFPSEVELPVDPRYTVDVDTYIQQFRENIAELVELAGKNSETARGKMKQQYDKQAKVTANKFKVGEKAMVIFPGSNRRSPHRKLMWKSFGPFRIVELSDSTAIVIPADKPGDTPQKVPLERLVKVPDGIPDISTLPKGKSPYRNQLNTIISIVSLICQEQEAQEDEGNKPKEKFKECKSPKVTGNYAEAKEISSGESRSPTGAKTREGEGIGLSDTKAKRNSEISIGQLRAIAISEGEERMETDHADNPLSWDTQCGGLGLEHRHCAQLTASDLDPVLEKAGLGLKVVGTPMKAVLASFLLKSSTVSSTAGGRKLAQMVLGTAVGYEMVTYFGGREDIVRSGGLPTEEEMEKAFEAWVEKCAVTRAKLGKTGFAPIQMAVPSVVEELPEAEKKSWADLFGKASFLLEKVRATTVHRKQHFVTAPRVIVGDSSAKQLLELWPSSQFIGTEQGGVGDVIRAFDGMVLSSKVRAGIILVGRDALMSGETAENVMDRVERLAKLCAQFRHVNFIWVAPPFVKDRHSEYDSLVQKLREFFSEGRGPGQFVTTTASGRSLLEMWRYGNGHNTDNVSASGEMTSKGLHVMKAWLTTQVPGFPGDRELGLRFVRGPTDPVVRVLAQAVVPTRTTLVATLSGPHLRGTPLVAEQPNARRWGQIAVDIAFQRARMCYH
uniref:RNA-directed DNA polymerase n=1 Tax=Globodera rostochiensis TaxID=31243 RepID=A0A914H3L2_GLORO